MSNTPGIANRKALHIEACLSEQSRSGRSNGLDRYRFDHQALPELDFAKVETSTRFLGKDLWAPLMISPMTGGTQAAATINENLARAAQERRIAMGVGSQRAALEHEELRRTFEIRRLAPDAVLFANLGAVQLGKGMGVSECTEAVKMIEADALFLHLNPLQEVLQDGGDTDFSGLLRKIERVCRELDVPVFAREVSSGISSQMAHALLNAGVTGIDVGGVGGTSWAKVEGMISENAQTRALSELFADWGHDVAESLLGVREISRTCPLIASGGIRDGIAAAKAIALGADLASIAGGFLQAGLESVEAVLEVIDTLREALRITLFCTGLGTVANLQGHFLEGQITQTPDGKVVKLRA